MIKSHSPSDDVPVRYHPHRVRRTRLQSALKDKVPEGIIQLNKRLSSLENLDDETVLLSFEDDTQVTVDLVVGGDGIRSVSHSPFWFDVVCLLNFRS